VNNLYANARVRFLTAAFNWPPMVARLLAWTHVYAFNETHLTVINIGVPVAESELITGLSVTATGHAKGNNAWFQDVPLTTPWLFLTLVDETGGLTGGARKLIAYYDTGMNLPRQPNGQDELVIPDWLDERGWFRP